MFSSIIRISNLIKKLLKRKFAHRKKTSNLKNTKAITRSKDED